MGLGSCWIFSKVLARCTAELLVRRESSDTEPIELLFLVVAFLTRLVVVTPERADLIELVADLVERAAPLLLLSLPIADLLVRKDFNELLWVLLFMGVLANLARLRLDMLVANDLADLPDTLCEAPARNSQEPLLSQMSVHSLSASGELGLSFPVLSQEMWWSW